MTKTKTKKFKNVKLKEPMPTNLENTVGYQPQTLTTEQLLERSTNQVFSLNERLDVIPWDVQQFYGSSPANLNVSDLTQIAKTLRLALRIVELTLEEKS